MIEDYVRNARVLNVVDGDTLDLQIDLGFKIWITLRVRLLGINCPEMKGATLAEAQKAKNAVKDWLLKSETGSITVRTHLDKTDNFGRVLVEIWIADESLNTYLLDNGHAVPYRK